jgi:spermidine/putrescine transport system permease protein
MKGESNPLRRFPGTGLMGWLFMAYLYVPLIILIALSFNANRSATIWTGFSFDWYSAILRNEQILIAARNSLIIAVTATIISTVIATLAALAMTARFRGENAANLILALPLVVPEVITAVASLLFFAALSVIAVMLGLPSVKLGLTTVLIVHIVFCIPFAYLPIRARLEGMDKTLKEAANDLYANHWWTFYRVTLPLLWPGVISGAMLAFIISLDDFVITSFVAGAGSNTLPIYIYTSIRIGISPEVNAISSVMLVISVIFVSVSYLIGRKR